MSLLSFAFSNASNHSLTGLLSSSLIIARFEHSAIRVHFLVSMSRMRRNHRSRSSSSPFVDSSTRLNRSDILSSPLVSFAEHLSSFEHQIHVSPTLFLTLPSPSRPPKLTRVCSIVSSRSLLLDFGSQACSSVAYLVRLYPTLCIESYAIFGGRRKSFPQL